MKQMLVEASEVAEYKLEGANVKLNEKLKLMQEFGLNLADIDFELDAYNLEELRAKFEDLAKKAVDDEDDKSNTTQEQDVSDEGTEDDTEDTADMSLQKYSMTAEQFRKELSCAIHAKCIHNRDACRYWLLDYDAEVQIAICEDCECGYLLVAIPYTVSGDAITVEFEKAYRVKAVYEPLEAAAETENVSEVAERIDEYVKGAVAEVEQKYAPIVAERDELKKFKDGVEEKERADAEEEVFNKFSELSGNETFEALKQKASKFSIEELEEKCFAIKGRTAVFAHKPAAQKAVVLPVAGMRDDNSDEPYGGIVKKFTKK